MTGDIFRLYHPGGLPTPIFIGPEGAVRSFVLAPLNEAAAIAQVEAILPRAGPTPSRSGPAATSSKCRAAVARFVAWMNPPGHRAAAEGGSMRYILFTFVGPERVAEWEAMTADEKVADIDRHKAWFAEHGALGRIVGGEELGRPGSARTVRMRGITDGPFIESKELLGGFIVVEVEFGGGGPGHGPNVAWPRPRQRPRGGLARRLVRGGSRGAGTSGKRLSRFQGE